MSLKMAFTEAEMQWHGQLQYFVTLKCFGFETNISSLLLVVHYVSLFHPNN